MCNYNPEELPALVAELNGWLNEQLPQESIFFTFMEHPARKTVSTPIVCQMLLDVAESYLSPALLALCRNHCLLQLRRGTGS